MNCKMPEFFGKSPLSGVGKHPDFQVTLWSSRRKALSFQDIITPIRQMLTYETEFVWLLKFQRTHPRFSPIEHLCRLRDTKTLN